MLHPQSSQVPLEPRGVAPLCAGLSLACGCSVHSPWAGWGPSPVHPSCLSCLPLALVLPSGCGWWVPADVGRSCASSLQLAVQPAPGSRVGQA